MYAVKTRPAKGVTFTGTITGVTAEGDNPAYITVEWAPKFIPSTHCQPPSGEGYIGWVLWGEDECPVYAGVDRWGELTAELTQVLYPTPQGGQEVEMADKVSSARLKPGEWRIVSQEL
jgi:hypothetical protein